MKQISPYSGTIAVLLLLCAAADSLAKARISYDLSTVPRELTEAKTVEQIRPFLDLARPIEERIVAVRRLGEIADPAATQALLKTFRKEPPHHGIDNFPIIKQEILKALAKKSGDQKVKRFLWDTLNETLSRGPTDAVHAWGDPEYLCVAIGAIESLSAFADDRILARFDAIAADDTLDWGIGQKAYECRLRIRVKQAGMEELDQKAADYLVPLLTGVGEGQAGAWVKGKPSKTPQALQNDAVVCILSDFSPEMIPYLESKIVKTPDEVQQRKNFYLGQAINNIRLKQDRREWEAIRSAAMKEGDFVLAMRAHLLAASKNRRRDCLHELARIQTDQATQVLLESLANPANQDLTSATLSILQNRVISVPVTPQQLEIVAAALQTGDYPQEIAWAARTLGNMKTVDPAMRTQRLWASLMETVKRPDESTFMELSSVSKRQFLIRQILFGIEAVGRDAIEPLQKMANDLADDSVRYDQIARGFAGDSSATSKIVALLAGDPDGHVRALAACSLRGVPQVDLAVQTLVAALHDPFSIRYTVCTGESTVYPVRESAAQTLREWGYKISRNQNDFQFAPQSAL